MGQEIHTKQALSVTDVVNWMTDLVAETNEDETPVHTIQQFQIVNTNFGNSYQGVVLCDHNQHE